MIKNSWDLKTLNTRISDHEKRSRFEAGSPNITEILGYEHYLKTGLQITNIFEAKAKRILILGMTPELRQMALKLGCQVISVDNNPESITIYRDWIPAEFRSNENIIESDWFNVLNVIDEPVDAILGDGVFGNILSTSDYLKLLSILGQILKRNGFLIFRLCLIPSGFPFEDYSSHNLISKFRNGTLTEAEFGFSMRKFSCYNDCYDHKSYLIDNRKIFKIFEKMRLTGIISDHEHSIINRYYFSGFNSLLPQEIWEDYIRSNGFSFTQLQLIGRIWYKYYPLYCCFKENNIANSVEDQTTSRPIAANEKRMDSSEC